MPALQDTGLIRLSRIIGDKKARPPIEPLIPISRASWWNGIREGRFPSPVRLGKRLVARRVADINRLIESGVAQ